MILSAAVGGRDGTVNDDTDAVRREALRLLVEEHRSVADVARVLGVRELDVEAWKLHHDEDANAAADAEIARLRRELARVREERDILREADEWTSTKRDDPRGG